MLAIGPYQGETVGLIVPFWAIKLFPRAGSPTITTQMRVFSTCTPMPFVLGAIVADVLVYWKKLKVSGEQGTLRIHVATELGAQ